MKIAALYAFADRSHSFKTDLRHKPRKSNVVVFAIYLAKFKASRAMSSIKINIKKGLPFTVNPFLNLIGFPCIKLFVLISKVTTLSAIFISKQTTRFTKINEKSAFLKKSALTAFH